MTQRLAEGTFEVALKPVDEAGASISAFSMNKTFSGDLVGTSTGQMLGFRTQHEDSAGYVAMELVTGTLAGRHGTFVLQHSGTMDRGAQTATISVVPQSGTNGLVGIDGKMDIRVEAGQHHYALRYTLPN